MPHCGQYTMGIGSPQLPLTVKRPVLHFILDTAFADAVGGQPIDHARDGIRLVIQSVEEIGVYHLPFACISFFLHIAAPNDRNDINAELFGKGVVPLIVRRDCHMAPVPYPIIT